MPDHNRELRDTIRAHVHPLTTRRVGKSPPRQVDAIVGLLAETAGIHARNHASGKQAELDQANADLAAARLASREMAQEAESAARRHKAASDRQERELARLRQELATAERDLTTAHGEAELLREHIAGLQGDLAIAKHQAIHDHPAPAGNGEPAKPVARRSRAAAKPAAPKAAS